MRQIGTRLYAIAIIALCALLAPVAAHAVRTEMNIATLRGLGGVHVIVQPLDKDLVKDGLAQDAIQTSAEQRLRAAGLKILSEDELGKESGGILFLALDTVKGDGGQIYACNISAELIQVASLSRSPDDMIPATTWTSGMVALVSASNVAHVRDMTLEVVDQFAKDYQAANKPEVSKPKIESL